MATITEVTRDDSLMPRISTPVISSAMTIAGMLKRAVSPAIDSGSGMPRSPSSWSR
jgi:hypothetical protein